MDPDANNMLSALKFLTYESQHICRLCFTSTEQEEVSFEDDVRLQRDVPFIDETVSFLDMFNSLGVSLEPSLPLAICMNCATMTINSYLFKKLCEMSDENWNLVLNRLQASLDQSMRIRPQVQAVYLIMKDKENQILTSRKRHILKSKKIAVNRIQKLIEARKLKHTAKRRESDVICEECGKRLSTNCDLVKHLKVHRKPKHLCHKCPKSFSSKLQLQEHAERLHYPKKIKCPKCSKKFSTDKMLNIHEKFDHVAVTCKLCFIQFPSRRQLKAHLPKHEVKNCPRCNKELNKKTFKLHLEICGNIQVPQPSFFCDICHKGYVRKNGLRSHIKTDHGFGNILSCNWCGKKYDAISKLNNHIVKHTKERNFHCDQCGGKFVTQAALVYHTRLHTGERPFPCDLCNESFLNASRRTEHKRRKHFAPTKECHVCHVKFVTGNQLKKHLQRHYDPHSKLFVPEAESPFAGYQNITFRCE